MPPSGSTFVKLVDLPEEIISAFNSTPWAMKLISDPNIHAITNESQVVKQSTTADTLMGRTLATKDTIKAWQSFRKDETDEPGKFGEVLSLVSIGSGVNGHIDISHGGFISVLLDEALGLSAEGYRPADKTTMTAYLKVEYKRPIKTPCIVLIRAGVEKCEGRKLWVRGTIEDGKGTVLSTGEALFIILDRKTLRGLL